MKKIDSIDGVKIERLHLLPEEDEGFAQWLLLNSLYIPPLAPLLSGNEAQHHQAKEQRDHYHAMMFPNSRRKG